MTMRVKIENLGPAQYLAVLESKQYVTKVLKMGESHETYVYPGAELTISEINAPTTNG